MSNVLFKLRVRSKKAKEASICLEYYFSRTQRLSYPTGLKCDPKIWDKKKQEVKNLVTATSKDVINKALRDLKSDVEEWLTKQKVTKTEPTRESLRAFLDSKTKPEKPSLPRLSTYAGEVDAFFSDFINKADRRTDPKTGRKLGQATLYSYDRAFEYLKEFEKQKGQLLKFSDIGLMFYQDYMAFLQAKGLSTNSCGREIKTLKVFFNEAVIQGKDLNREYFKKGVFKVTKEEADNISLTEAELRRLYALKLDNPTLDRVRDVFLVGCYTGLRYSDYSTLSSLNIHGEMIRLRMKKTDGDVSIPLHPVVKAIFEKYGGTLPKSRRTGKPITSQKFNQYLQKVCNTVMDDGKPCIFGTESKRITKGGVRLFKTLQRADMVSSHTARRTFATLNYLKGVRASVLMRITGHKTESAFRKYIKVTNDQSAQEMAEIWHKTGEYMIQAK